MYSFLEYKTKTEEDEYNNKPSASEMSADHLQFLNKKFMEDLVDVEKEQTGENEIPLHSLFLQIRHVFGISFQ